MTEIAPKDVMSVASDLKERVVKDMGDHKDAAALCLGIDVLAALVIKLMLCEGHFKRIADNLEEQTAHIKQIAGQDPSVNLTLNQGE